MEKITVLVFGIILCQSAFAENLQIGRFASFDNKEDGSAVSIEEVSTVAYVTTYGGTLALRGCNSGKIKTGEAGPYAYHYKEVVHSSVIASRVMNDSVIEITDAKKILQKLKENMNVPFYCKVNSGFAIKLRAKILNTNRVVNSIINGELIKSDLVIIGANGAQDIDSEITLFETLEN